MDMIITLITNKQYIYNVLFGIFSHIRYKGYGLIYRTKRYISVSNFLYLLFFEQLLFPGANLKIIFNKFKKKLEKRDRKLFYFPRKPDYLTYFHI